MSPDDSTMGHAQAIPIKDDVSSNDDIVRDGGSAFISV